MVGVGELGLFCGGGGNSCLLVSLLLSAGGGEGDLPDVVPGLCCLYLATRGCGLLLSDVVHRATGLSDEILLTLRHQSLMTLQCNTRYLSCLLVVVVVVVICHLSSVICHNEHHVCETFVIIDIKINCFCYQHQQ